MATFLFSIEGFYRFEYLPYLPYSVSVHQKWLHIIHCIILYLHITSILQCHIPSLYITSDLHILHCHTLCLRIYHMCSSHPTSQVFYISYIVITRVYPILPYVMSPHYNFSTSQVCYKSNIVILWIHVNNHWTIPYCICFVIHCSHNVDLFFIFYFCLFRFLCQNIIAHGIINIQYCL